jgi:hypothetical protein
VGFGDIHQVDIIDDLNAGFVGLAEQIGNQRLFSDHQRRRDVLTMIDSLIGQQTFAVQPIHVHDE